MGERSLIEWLGLPENFGYALLIVGLVLLLAPYLHGSDFGIIKIPKFDPPTRRSLRVVGPMFMLFAVLLHIKISESHTGTRTVGTCDDGVLEWRGGLSWSYNCNDVGEDSVSVAASSQAPTGQDDKVLAPFSGGNCLYPASVVALVGAELRVRFKFGQTVNVPVEGVRALPSSPPASAARGQQVFAHLGQSDVWAPGEVQELRGGNRVLVGLDTTADCAGQYAKQHLWVSLDDRRVFVERGQ
jgi:hypothetical protein